MSQFDITLAEKISPIAPASHPSHYLHVIGVTGTNGKTTVSHLIGKALNDAGFNAYVLGTLNSGDCDLTTPLADDTARIMHEHLANGGTHFVMEVSSEGIVEGRVDQIEFDIKILTNITPDHLDYHKTFENYRNAKMQFMNSGDAVKILPKNFVDIPVNFASLLLGEFNRLNLQTAIAALQHAGLDAPQIERSLATCPPPKGRLQAVEKGQDFSVLIDYAHTPDALEKVLSSLKAITQTNKSRLHVVFGCGGNRDHSKRPKMGRIATEYADQVIVSDDNPRHEDGQSIIDQIVSGFVKSFTHYKIIRDRRDAIAQAVHSAQNNDILLIAGKGHENYQIVGDKTLYFDDYIEAENALENLLTVQQAS